MISRRDFIQASLAASTLFGGALPRLARAQALTEDGLADFRPVGSVTLIHVTDIHAQLKPVFFREPSINIGVGQNAGVVPHITGEEFLKLYGIEPGSVRAYALTSEGFESLALEYGRMGGLDRVARIVARIRADRPEALLLDGGDTWQGSWTALQTEGRDMIEVMNAIGPDAMTSHWEFTYGGDRVREAVDALPYPFLGANIFDAEWDEPAFDGVSTFERGGVKIAVIGQAFPYLPIANPGWMFPDLSFGIREERIQALAQEARDDGAGLVVLLSHNGFDVDRKMAERVPALDVILSGHTHDALPEPVQVGKTLIVASGSNGKFVSRLDLEVRDGGVQGFGYRLIPIFSDAIAPDPEITALIDKVRAPYEAELAEVLGRTEGLLFRRGNFNGTWDDLICESLMQQRDAQIALSPGFRWGTSLPAGHDITRDDLWNQTAITYPAAYRNPMTGEMLKAILEDVADNLFNPDPYYQQGGDMVRVGGMGYAIDVTQPIGRRISDMTLLATGEPIDPAKEYVVSGWASVNPETEGPPVWEVCEAHIRDAGTIRPEPNRTVRITGA